MNCNPTRLGGVAVLDSQDVMQILFSNHRGALELASIFPDAYDRRSICGTEAGGESEAEGNRTKITD